MTIKELEKRIKNAQLRHKRRCLKLAKKYLIDANERAPEYYTQQEWYQECIAYSNSNKERANNFNNIFSLHYCPKLKIFKNRKVLFNPITLEAKSYNWWVFVKKIKNKLVFNDYKYSMTTNRHQSQVRDLLNELGIEIDLFVDCPKGLQNLESGIEYYTNIIAGLINEINNPNSKKAKNLKRIQAIKFNRMKIKHLQNLMK